MPQLFRPYANTLARASLLGAALVLVGIAWAGYEVTQSSSATGVGTPVTQAVPFSHAHHVGGLGIDCRYCHTTVETSSFAGMPATQTCMTCHSFIWRDSPMLAPVRESDATGVPLEWSRVNNLPDYVYFNHRMHVSKGIGCVSCHGRVDRMPLTWKTESFRMSMCLDCHRAPEKYVRPREAVFDMAWEAPPGLDRVALAKEYHLDSRRMVNCYVCHR